MGEKSLRRGTDNQNGLHVLMKKDGANGNDFVTKNQDFWSISDNRGDSRGQGQRDFGDKAMRHTATATMMTTMATSYDRIRITMYLSNQRMGV